MGINFLKLILHIIIFIVAVVLVSMVMDFFTDIHSIAKDIHHYVGLFDGK